MHRITIIALSLLISGSCQSQSPAASNKKNAPLAVIAYYSGDAGEIDKYPVEKLTHIIYSFCYLKDGKLVTGSTTAGNTIKKLVSLKKKQPGLKILLSLGGWGGCKDCSEAFSTAEGRQQFARSTKALIDQYGADGIDLDWEYPTIEGYPGHRFVPEDKDNFTELVRALRKELGRKQEISFAAGGFTKFLQESVEWKKLLPLIDRVNIMSYDLINGYSTVTGHHTPLYSTTAQVESTDHAIRFLDSIGFSRNKVVIGAAFYARVFEGADSVNNGLYRPGKFKSFITYKSFKQSFTPEAGYVFHWDDTAMAPYAYHAGRRHFATFDDLRSIRLKTQYAIDKGLNGIMFWELTLDIPANGLLDELYKTKQAHR